MKRIHIFLYCVLALGVAFVIPGAVVLYFAISCSGLDACTTTTSQAIPILATGVVLLFLSIVGFFFAGSTDPPRREIRIDPETGERIQYWRGNAEQPNGYLMEESNPDQSQWQAEQQAQWQYSYNRRS
jgi:hypothetical protein